MTLLLQKAVSFTGTQCSSVEFTPLCRRTLKETGIALGLGTLASLKALRVLVLTSQGLRVFSYSFITFASSSQYKQHSLNKGNESSIHFLSLPPLSWTEPAAARVQPGCSAKAVADGCPQNAWNKEEVKGSTDINPHLKELLVGMHRNTVFIFFCHGQTTSSPDAQSEWERLWLCVPQTALSKSQSVVGPAAV